MDNDIVAIGFDVFDRREFNLLQFTVGFDKNRRWRSLH